VTTLFKSLDRAEEHLAKNANPFYFGDKVTEADVRLYTVSDAVCLYHRSCEAIVQKLTLSST
jgi:putative glutathione S-transferase